MVIVLAVGLVVIEEDDVLARYLHVHDFDLVEKG